VSVKAQTSSKQLNGWAWSSNIGWISFNSADSGAGGSPYNVFVNDSGNFGGYAWSPNIGWISFNSADLSGCPGVITAHVSTSTGSVTGWARAIAGVGRTDGWDGCIELSGTNHPTGDITGAGGVTYDRNTGIFKGFAWGDVVGWISFSPTLIGVPPVVCPDCNNGGGNEVYVTSCLPTNVVANGGNFNITWTASATGGTSPYMYSWNGGAYGSNQYTAINVPQNATTNVVAKDSSGKTSITSTCPAPSVPSTGDDIVLKLRRGTATPFSGTSNLQIPSGNQFFINWNVPSLFAGSFEGVGGDCNIVNIVPPHAAWSLWSISTINATLPVGETGPLDTSTTGIYRFNLTCSHSREGLPAIVKSGTATLRVTSSNIEEI